MGMLVAPMRPMATTGVKIVTWILRIVALVALVILFAISIREFYSVNDPSKVSYTMKRAFIKKIKKLIVDSIFRFVQTVNIYRVYL